MKTYEVLSTKSYIVKIKAKDKDSAKEFAQVYTGDISDISYLKEKEHNFTIEDIDCKTNEILEVKEEN